MGVIEKTELSDWAAPIVPVIKQDGSVRICVNYKMTVNQQLRLIPTPSLVLRTCSLL